MFMLLVVQTFKQRQIYTHLDRLHSRSNSVVLLRSNAKFGRFIDLPVDKQHNAERQVKSTKGREDSVGWLLAHLALHRFLWVGLSPSELRREGDNWWEHPCKSDHHVGDPLASLQGVLEVPCDGPIAIERDGGDVPDAGCAAEYVEGDPHLTQSSPEDPLAAVQLPDQAQRHHQSSHHHVWDSHGGHQVVRNTMERADSKDGHEDQHVPHKRGQNQHGQQGEGQDTEHRHRSVWVSMSRTVIGQHGEAGVVHPLNVMLKLNKVRIPELQQVKQKKVTDQWNISRVEDLEILENNFVCWLTVRSLVSAWSLQISGSLLRVCESKSFLSFSLICLLHICILMPNLLGEKVSFWWFIHD